MIMNDKSDNMRFVITYRRTSRLSLRIGRGGELRVSAPIGFPKQRILEFIDEKRAWIEDAQARVRVRAGHRDNFYDRLPLTNKQQVREAAEKLCGIVEPMFAKHGANMGVKPKLVKFNTAKTRWGSCNKVNGHINLSLYLLLLPEWCIEHVVVHELAHLIEANHGPEFHSIVETHFPRWREAKAMTRQILRGLAN